LPDHVYKVVELVGSSEAGLEPAIRNAIGRAAETVRNLRWFEVTLKAGFVVDRDGG